MRAVTVREVINLLDDFGVSKDSIRIFLSEAGWQPLEYVLERVSEDELYELEVASFEYNFSIASSINLTPESMRKLYTNWYFIGRELAYRQEL